MGNNAPVFFVKDGLKFPDFIHSQKRDPRTNMRSKTMMWDFWSLMPESLHQALILMSDRGTPYGIRHMHGYSSHTLPTFNQDYDLSAFSANRLGLGLRYAPLYGLSRFKTFFGGRVAKFKPLDVRYGYYRQSTGLTANVVSADLSFVLP